MKKTYQPFIIEKADQILEILKDDIQPTEHAKESLCMLLTQKFIKGTLSPEDDVRCVFDSEEELLEFVNKCYTRENLEVLKEKGLVGVYEDDGYEELFFLTEQGKLYLKELSTNP